MIKFDEKGNHVEPIERGFYERTLQYTEYYPAYFDFQKECSSFLNKDVRNSKLSIEFQK